MRLFIVFAAFALVLSGCGGGPAIEEVTIYEGSDGIDFEIMTDNPPERVYPNQIFAVTLDLHLVTVDDLVALQ